ncbi:LemA family protein [Halocola ammonii]
MNKTVAVLLSIVGVIGLIFLIFWLWAASVHDSAVQYQEQVDKEWNDVQATYQRRADLIPNLVNTVKGAAENEKEILTRVTEARAGIADAKTPGEIESVGRKINSTIGLVFERYPQIRSTENFAQLQSQLEGTENRINVARQRYNESVSKYNSYIRGYFKKTALSFTESPDDNFTTREGFQADPGSEDAPEVQF